MTTDAPDARLQRRHRALVAYLTNSRELDFDALDTDNPLLNSATLAEFRAAVAEVEARSFCPLTKILTRWLDGADELSLGAKKTVWLPINEARYTGLHSTPYLGERTVLIFNHLELFQVSVHKPSSSRMVYHVQSLVGRESGAYYRQGPTMPPVKLLDLPTRFPAHRNPTGIIASSLFIEAWSWPKTEPIRPISQPLHTLINTIPSGI